jgi:hypothetical protein
MTATVASTEGWYQRNRILEAKSTKNTFVAIRSSARSVVLVEVLSSRTRRHRRYRRVAACCPASQRPGSRTVGETTC